MPLKISGTDVKVARLFLKMAVLVEQHFGHKI